MYFQAKSDLMFYNCVYIFKVVILNCFIILRVNETECAVELLIGIISQRMEKQQTCDYCSSDLLMNFHFRNARLLVCWTENKR